jgi:ketosteroid isomerase-like protein
MSISNKTILEQGNAAISRGDNEGLLVFCTEDTEWTFVGDRVLRGKEAVRLYMKEAYVEPPQFNVEQFIADGDFVIAIGKIAMKDGNGTPEQFEYCDVWRFENGKIAALKAFVVKPNDE